jgi:tRNA threonylcarbamoyl adenosine modification protein (Sua5/YciO/YrdC/YwlC family)
MAEWLTLHAKTPQARFIQRAAECLQRGGVIAYPTDSCYALGACIGDKAAAERIRRIRRFDRHHLFTLMCRDLSDIANYAQVGNAQYRLLRALTPGPYTFVLQATRELPRRVLHERRKTIGIRVPNHPAAQQLLSAMGEPLISCTLQFPDAEDPVSDPGDWRSALSPVVDLVLDGGACGVTPSTVVDLTEEAPRLVRVGKGEVEPLGLEAQTL